MPKAPRRTFGIPGAAAQAPEAPQEEPVEEEPARRSERAVEPLPPAIRLLEISSQLFDRARAQGINIRGGQARTKPIKSENDLKKLGLPDTVIIDLEHLAGGRNASLMIYKDSNALLARERPYMVLQTGGN